MCLNGSALRRAVKNLARKAAGAAKESRSTRWSAVGERGLGSERAGEEPGDLGAVSGQVRPENFGE